MSKKRFPALIGWDLFALFAALFVIFLPQWDPYRYPQHDSLFYFQSFYAFYNNFFYNAELAQWFPYGMYGIQANYWQLMNLAPSAYAVGVVGYIFKIKDVLLLFKCSIFLDLVILASGAFLLGLQMFRMRSAAFLAALIVSASTVWYTQLDWNFRVYYLLPYSFYFLNKYFTEKKAHWFWWASSVMLISLIGNIVYVIAMNALLLAMYFIWMSVLKRFGLRHVIQPTRENIFSVIFFVSTLLLFIFFISSFFREVSAFMNGRIEGQFGVTLNDFLTYGPRIGFTKFANIFYTGVHELQEQKFYCGAMAVLLTALALMRVRNFSFYIWIVLLVLLALFSVGRSGGVAEFLYRFYFPMRFYRYIGHIGGWFRLFFAFAAGYGFCAWLEMSKLKSRDRYRILGFCCFMILILYAIAIVSVSSYEPLTDLDSLFSIVSLIAASILLAGGVLIRSISVKLKKIALITFVFLELLAYQQLIFADWVPWKEVPQESVKVRKDYFKPFRILNHTELDPDQVPAMKMMEIAYIRANQEFYNYSMIDSCVTMDPSIQASSRVQRLTESLFDATVPALSLLTDRTILGAQPNMAVFLTITACHNPKLLLTNRVTYAFSEASARKALAAPINGFGRVVLEGVSDVNHYDSNDPSRALLDADHIRVDHFSFNRLDLHVLADGPGPVWLYYADAYHPGWKVKIDGRPGRVAQANLAFKAVQVPPGSHRVQFFFFDGWYSFASIAIAFLSLIMVLMWLYHLFLITFVSRSQYCEV